MEFDIYIAKCKIMKITTCFGISKVTYTMNNILLEFVDQHKYLRACLHKNHHGNHM